MDTSPTEISSLISIIAGAANSLEAYHKTEAMKPSVPSLNDTAIHPLDTQIYPLDMRKALQRLEGACVQLCATLARPNHHILNRYLSIFEPACIGVVLRARVADVLLDKPDGLPIAEISEQCGIEQKKLSRVLRTLCSRHIFREITNNVFANNRLSMELVSSNPMWNIGMHLTDEPNNKAISYMADTLLDAEWGSSKAPERSAFNRAFGTPYPLWHYFEGNDNKKAAEQGARFAKGMVGWNNAADAEGIIHGFPWDQLPSGAVVNDLGGGWGHVAMQLYRKNPNLHLVLQDLPERVQQAKSDAWPRECPEAIANGKIEFIAVDLLKDVAVPGCDIYLMKSVLHTMPHDKALLVLSNLHKVMTPNSRILIDEYIMQGANRLSDEESKLEQAPLPLLPNYGAGRIRQYYLDMVMLAHFNGEERTLDDYIELGNAAGLRFVKLWNLGEMALVELALKENQ